MGSIWRSVLELRLLILPVSMIEFFFWPKSFIFSIFLLFWIIACELPTQCFRQKTCYICGFSFLWAKSYILRLEQLDYDHTHRLLTCLLVGCFQKEWNKNNTSSVATILYVLHSDKDAKLRLSNLSFFFCFSHQGRHVKTGQLAAIKVMDVTEVSKCHIIWFRLWN